MIPNTPRTAVSVTAVAATAATTSRQQQQQQPIEYQQTAHVHHHQEAAAAVETEPCCRHVSRYGNQSTQPQQQRPTRTTTTTTTTKRTSMRIAAVTPKTILLLFVLCCWFDNSSSVMARTTATSTATTATAAMASSTSFGLRVTSHHRTLQQQQQQQNNTTTRRHEDDPNFDNTNIEVILSNPLRDGRDLLTVGGFVESDQCYIDLTMSDSDNDGRVINEEYVTFVFLSTDVLTDNDVEITQFNQLPLVFQLAFSSAACLCNNPLAGGNVDDTDCCIGDNAHIRIPVSPSNNPNATEINYLYTTCSLTQGAAEVYLTSDAPTTSAPVPVPVPVPVPSPSPSPPTLAPTNMPPIISTMSPIDSTDTLSPTTNAPVEDGLSVEPSVAPVSTIPVASQIPTIVPTTIPTIEATLSDVPTMTPIVVVSTTIPTTSPSISDNNDNTTTVVVENLESMIMYSISIQRDVEIATEGVEYNETIFVSEYLNNLKIAMDTMAANAAMNLSTSSSSATNRRQRQLQETNNSSTTASSSTIQVSLPTEIEQIVTIPCPEYDSINQSSSTCQSIAALIEYNITIVTAVDNTTAPAEEEDNDAVNTTEIQSMFNDMVLQSVRDGSFQMELDTYEWASNNNQNPILVLTGLTDVPIVTPPVPSTPPPINREIESGSDPLSSGGIAGISIGAAALLSMILGIALVKRHQLSDDEYNSQYDDKKVVPYNNDDAAMDEFDDIGDQLNVNESMADQSIYTDDAISGGGSAAIISATTLGASPAFYGSSKKPASEIAMGHENNDDDDDDDDIKEIHHPSMDDRGGMILSDDRDNNNNLNNNNNNITDDDDDGNGSSNAGSSGWSSSAGISSLNTGSMDEMDNIAAAAGATLAGIGLASAFSRNLSKRGGGDRDTIGGALGDVHPSDTDDAHSDIPSVSRDQLDSLIESGDWAAVGATAALLAAASDSQSGTSLSRGAGTGTGTHSRSRDTQSVDAARAAELDHLVDAGDWEGVVAAAAKFEAQAETGTASGTGSGTGSRSSRTHSSVESSGGSGSHTGTGTNTAGSPSIATSLSDTASKAQKREEIRAEVEALVRRVVPEEIDNVDEMMNQFKGREEELVETLRTMQERAVAQKARAAGHRAAKTEARRSVQRSGSSGPVAPGSVVQKVTSLEIKEAASGTGGIAAAGIGMAATSTAALLKASSRDATDKKPAAKPRGGEPKVVVDARSALEDAIEAGDWEAVGEAAAMISDHSVTSVSTGEIDRLASTNLSISTTGTGKSREKLSGLNAERAAELDALVERGDWSGVVSVANRFSSSDKKDMSESTGVRSKEEEEALLEAELWMKIADQKKAEGAMDAGASDAAEWAIQRSLSQLHEAEKKQRRGNIKGEDEV